MMRYVVDHLKNLRNFTKSNSVILKIKQQKNYFLINKHFYQKRETYTKAYIMVIFTDLAKKNNL